MKYLEHRSRDGNETREDRAIFSQDSDHVTRKDAVDDLMQHRSSRVNNHHLILSPDPREPVSDLQQWTRDIMRDFTERQGKDVHWYAVTHTNTADHPHVHVVVGGGATAPGKERLQPVVIKQPELTHLHESALEHSDHELYRLMDELHTLDMREAQEPEHIHELDTLFDEPSFDF